MFSRILILFFLTSCSLFKGSEKLTNQDVLVNLQAVKVEGEGKGRLHIRERQYLFGVESILREDNDWVMAVSIPLHGEEALIFPKLQQENVQDLALESFALRIDEGIRENLKGSDLKGADFLGALRKTLRFLLAHKLKLPVICVAREKEYVCTLGGEEFIVTEEEKSLRVSTRFAGHQLVANASNLTGPIFQHTQFRVLSPEGKQDLITLELFWKE